MILYLLISIAYRRKFVIYTSRSQYELPSFGFDANGTYLIDIEDIPSDSQTELKIAFLNKNDYKNYFFKFFPPSICDLQGIPKFDINYSQHTLKGTFPTKTDLFPFIIRCDTVFEYLDFTILTEYHNPTTFLDNRMVKGIKGEMSICVLYFAFSIAWLANWFLNFHHQRGLHYCLTAIIFLYMFSHILRFCELQQLDKSDNSKKLTNSRIIFSYFAATFCCLFFLLGSEGYCILIDSLPIQRILTTFIVSALIAGCLYLTIYYNFAENLNMIILLDFVSVILYAHELISAMKRANVQVIALLLTASNSGTNQSASSIIKNQQYIYFQRIMIAVLSLIIFFLILNYISFLFQKWIYDLLQNLAEISILAFTAFIFRPRKSSSTSPSPTEISNKLIDDDNDSIINDNENEIDGDEIPLSSIDSTDYLRNSPTPDQPLLQMTPSSEKDKKVDGNDYAFL